MPNVCPVTAQQGRRFECVNRAMREFLNETELADLSGRIQKAAQARWLRKNRFEFVLRADGTPRVLRDHVRARLGAMQGDKLRAKIEPNWAALDA
jgi:hypothetical protein